MLYKVVRKSGAENTCSFVHGYTLVKKGYVVALVRIYDSYVIDVAAVKPIKK